MADFYLVSRSMIYVIILKVKMNKVVIIWEHAKMMAKNKWKTFFIKKQNKVCSIKEDVLEIGVPGHCK